MITAGAMAAATMWATLTMASGSEPLPGNPQELLPQDLVVDIVIEPLSTEGDPEWIWPGGQLELTVRAITNGQGVAAVDISMTFDTDFLEVCKPCCLMRRTTLILS